METTRLNRILDYLREHPQSSSKEVFDALQDAGGYATIKRELSKAVSEGIILVSGQRKGSKYSLSPAHNLLHPVDLESYFSKEVDERVIFEGYNPELIDTLVCCNFRCTFRLEKTNQPLTTM